MNYEIVRIKYTIEFVESYSAHAFLFFLTFATERSEGAGNKNPFQQLKGIMFSGLDFR